MIALSRVVRESARQGTTLSWGVEGAGGVELGEEGLVRGHDRSPICILSVAHVLHHDETLGVIDLVDDTV